ncbi:adhesion G-protein coupled receptor F3 isoform X1 [Xyrichtys novacula]|uniref:Adhesion G-protein coupled receptor F3 isoform X1 n=1 Tax=Xyrichtys novacula TaxID=13765 RepID=A0AAV1GH05_XYRNO|nr:adhesion G-protein coupled receptor F3 isoform X1 [Xyrichtys novacula]
MWTFILFYFLGCFISQTSAEDYSTQMYYVKLKIELGIIPNLTKILGPFVSNTTLDVDDLQKTTTCQNLPDSSISCTCESDHRWTDEVCKSNPDCCDKEKCTFLQQSDRMCVSQKTVSVNGSITLTGPEFAGCVNEKTSQEFQDCNHSLLTKMKGVYSTINGFSSLTISKYRVGSIIADFEVTYASEFEPQELIDKSVKLSKTLSSSFILETTGVAKLSLPSYPVRYHSKHTLTCKVDQDLNASVSWQMKRQTQIFKITTGTESRVSIAPLETNIELKNISELWAGEYTCVFFQRSDSGIISHKASGVLDVCPKPKIYISTYPSFPHCLSSSGFLEVTAQCDIGSSIESYSVTWNNEHGQEMTPVSTEEEGVFMTQRIINCNSTTPQPQVTCTFENRCNETTHASIDINIIQGNDPFCEAEGDWEKAKAGFTARIRCKHQTGIRRRKCIIKHKKAVWEPEVSECVDQEIRDVLEKAIIVDIGLGAVHENTANVFSIFENVTNQTERIDSFPNLNTSVYVLSTMSQKIAPHQNEVVDDFLGSSSNLLERSLLNTWIEKKDEGNTSLAERYLDSVEQLIHMANITQRYKKKNVEVEAQNCPTKSGCTNKVFNVTVHLSGENPGYVKTAGFKELESYLPNNFEEKFEPNSIVVSTTTERNISGSVGVKITFPLRKQRPRNVEMICVAWDDKTQGWSEHKCEWKPEKGSDGVCECQHLSSFAILMGKYPLEVPWLTEATYAGLSISIISLIVTLVVELIVWNAVTKTNTSYFRHTAHVNICLCLLVADCCFLASSKSVVSPVWCMTFVLLKHFFYLSMFFWMLWLSCTLLHQTVFIFHNLSKKNYLRFSILTGYVCPLLIVITTILANKAGAEGLYYSKETCWLVYIAPLKGSIHTFVIPVGIIAFFNMFAMILVIVKLLDHPKNVSSACEKERKAAVTVLRTVILLTPIFGVTWILGLAVMLLDLKYGTVAYVANYAFILLNAFQGFFILLTTCFGDTMTREELLKRLKIKTPASTTNSCTDSTSMK